MTVRAFVPLIALALALAAAQGLGSFSDADSMPSLAFPFPGGETWRITCGYHDGNGCQHPDNEWNRYALDLQHVEGRSETEGKQVSAAAAGTVEFAGWGGAESSGWYVRIDHGDGYKTLYAHMQPDLAVSTGEEVRQGQTIGLASCSGRCTGAHIHFALLSDGSSIRPEPMCGRTGFDDGQEHTNCAPGAFSPRDMDQAFASISVQRSDGADVRALKDLKLESALVMLFDASERAEAAGDVLTPDTAIGLPLELRGMIDAGRLRLTGEGEVQVFVIVEEMSVGTVNALKVREVRVERIDEERQIIQVQVPIRNLRGVADIESVRTVRLPEYPFLNAGSITSEGDAVMNSDDARTTYGVDGAGFTVGVISDGVGGLADAQASGDLPVVDTATCNVAGGDPGAAGAEGTAMLEIVHDVAPGANLMFGNFGFATSLDFNATVNCLAANADIVVDDIGWFNVGLYDGTSSVSENTADALNGPGPVRGYYTSAGNQAGRHYQGTYVDSGFDVIDGGDLWSLHEFDVSPETKHGGASGPPSISNHIGLNPGETASLFLQWDDPWGASSNDYDLLYGDGTSVFACSLNPQDGDDLPAETCAITNLGSSPVAIEVIIGNWLDGAAAREFDLFVLCSAGCLPWGNNNTFDYNTLGSSVPNQGDAAGSPAQVISVGAVPHGSPTVNEQFSSRGPTNDGRLKPEIVAPDRICVTGAGGFKAGNPACQTTGRQFAGTSAAAPHVAGVAALLLHCDPTLDRNELRDRLLNNAVDLGTPGPDNTFGHGRVDALASASDGGCPPAKQAHPGDSDGDGCSDVQENGTNEALGGRRYYLNPWDFFDTNGDQSIDLFNDIFDVALAFGQGPGGPDYTTTKDRSLPPAPGVDPDDPDNNEPWDLGPPDDTIDLFTDIFGVSFQFGHDCS